MEHNDPTRRQYAPSSYPAQQPQQPQQPTNAPPATHYAAPNTLERFRQSAYLPQQSPTSAPSVGRAGDTQHMYGFAATASYGAPPPTLPSNSMQYGQDMQTPEQPRAQQPPTQQYTQYNTNLMYNMGQPQTPQSAPSPYEHVSHYRERTATGSSNTLATPFGVPQTAQYYLPSQPGPTSAPVPDAAPPQLASQYPQQPDPYGTAPGHPAPQSYPSAMMDQPQATSYAGYAGQQYAAQQQQQQQQTQHQQQQQQTQQTDDHAFDRYQAQVRNIFTIANEGSLRNAFTPLLDISYYLLGQAEQLGLTRDDHELHDGRVRLWDEFNRAWLSVLQRQLDLTTEALRSGRAPPEPVALLDAASLEQLSAELVKLGDGVEKHGLVDYQMGVAEEEIMELLLRCLALINPQSDDDRDSATVGASRGT